MKTKIVAIYEHYGQGTSGGMGNGNGSGYGNSYADYISGGGSGDGYVVSYGLGDGGDDSYGDGSSPGSGEPLHMPDEGGYGFGVNLGDPYNEGMSIRMVER